MKAESIKTHAIRSALEALLGKKEARIAMQAAPNGQAGAAILRAEDLGWY